MDDLTARFAEVTGNPVIDQRNRAAARTWEFLKRVTMEGRSLPDARSAVIDRLRDEGFRTRPMGMRGCAVLADQMLAAISGKRIAR